VARLYPVGRLDKDSEGLILLTDDGDWAQRLLHPRYAVEREYAVALRAPLDAGQAQALLQGIEFEEGLARLLSLRIATRPETARLERGQPGTHGHPGHHGQPGPPGQRATSWYRVVLTRGWRRQLRRMFAAVGAPVDRLVRVRIGTLRLDDMPIGHVRALSSAERTALAALARWS
jgi:pseudouridine synthase